MNKVILMGRLTKEPTIANNYARYTLAIDRKIKNDNEPSADFINCVAFGKSIEFVQKYLTKGMKIAVIGRIQTGSYQKDGQTIYTTDVVVEEHYFCESKHPSASVNTAPAESNNGFMTIPDGDDELPFA